MTRILLVDNDATRASLLKDILEGPGHYELLNCSDLTSAQEIYRNGHPHVSLVMCACEVGYRAFRKRGYRSTYIRPSALGCQLSPADHFPSFGLLILSFLPRIFIQGTVVSSAAS